MFALLLCVVAYARIVHHVPPMPLKPYTLVLDLDQTLYHYNVSTNTEFFRPHLSEFLTTLKDMYNLVLYSSGNHEHVSIGANSIKSHTGVSFDAVYSKDAPDAGFAAFGCRVQNHPDAVLVQFKSIPRLLDKLRKDKGWDVEMGKTVFLDDSHHHMIMKTRLYPRQHVTSVLYEEKSIAREHIKDNSKVSLRVSVFHGQEDDQELQNLIPVLEMIVNCEADTTTLMHGYPLQETMVEWKRKSALPTCPAMQELLKTQ